jgi:hypothetical protein
VPLNENYTALNNYTQAVNTELTQHVNAVLAHIDTAIQNTSGVAGANVRAALITLSQNITAHLNSMSAHSSSAIVNESTVVGARVSDALNTLKSSITSSSSASGVTNDSSITGVSVKDALNTLGVNTANHINSASAHLSSSITNDSSVVGTKVSNALDTLNTNTTNHINSTSAHNAQNITLTTSDPSLSPYQNVKLALEGLSLEIGEIIAQSGTSDTEVVNARLSSVFGSFLTLKDRLDNTDVKKANLTGGNTFTGQQNLPSTTTFKAEGGNEGGQFQLEKPTVGSTLDGDIVVDINNNIFRVYEGEGQTRGVYLDLSKCTESASSQLLATYMTPTGQNLNDLLVAGFYRIQDSLVNAPPASMGDFSYGNLIVVRHAGLDSLTQIIISLDSRVAVRTFASGSWGVWKQFATTDITTTTITSGFASGISGTVDCKKGLGNLTQINLDLLKSTDFVAGTQLLLTLPVGLRPLVTVTQRCAILNASQTTLLASDSIIYILTNGEVYLNCAGTVTNARNLSKSQFIYYSA